MSLAFVILWACAASYGVAFLLHIRYFSEAGKAGDRPGHVLLQAGFLLGTLYFLSRGLQSGYFLPIVSMSAALAFFAWTLAFVYLVLLGKARTEAFGLILSLILFILSLGAAMSMGQARDIQAIIKAHPYLLNPYFALHVVSAFFAYATFTISFVASVLYLIESRELKNPKVASSFFQKLPSLERLEKMVSRPLRWGTPLLLITTLSGLVWAQSAFHSFMLLDPKTIVTLTLLGLYGGILWRYWVSSVRGKEIASLSVISFAYIVIGFVTTLLLSGRHNFL